ncbi:MAG: DNA replication/repair protein RecF [Maricaulaceae bacterium]
MSRCSFSVQSLTLSEFRNYADARFTFDARPVVIVGPNGSGKTNLLEAISYLGPGRGLRGAGLSEPAQFGGSGRWALHAAVLSGSEERRIGVGLSPGPPAKRAVRLDGENANASDLAALVRLVWLAPAHDRLFASPRSDRRRFFDRLVLAFTPDHGAQVLAYEKAQRERQRVLDDGRWDPVWLDALEAEIARRGGAIACARRDALIRLQAEIDRRPDTVFPKADLSLHGPDGAAAGAADDPSDVQTRLADGLAASRRTDALAGRMALGPHRVDFSAVHRAKQTPAARCSTGEQKALLLGVALAQTRAVIATEAGPDPLPLFDEVAAHLDADRRHALADELVALGCQAWLTGTDAELFAGFGERAQTLRLGHAVSAESSG